jgi:hypothetical protein
VRSSARCGIIIEDVPLGGMIYYNVSVNNGGALTRRRVSAFC